MAREALKPFGKTETLYYYAEACKRLRSFLKGKEIAAKNWIPSPRMPYLIKRGSREKPLFAEDVAKAVDENFLRMREKKEHLEEARALLTPLQQNVWNYFPPRKLNDLFYATNGEKAGGAIERVFMDIDRGAGASAEKAQEAARELMAAIKDERLDGASPPFATWTGASFHVFIFYKKPKPAPHYSEIAVLTKKWAGGIGVAWGHEKKKGAITLDPSQTPAGKLCRAPFSLHMGNWKSVDGVAVPLGSNELEERGLVKRLQAITPARVLEEMDGYAGKLPL